MKRSSLLAVLTFALAFSTATTAQACCYTPWLDPLAWLGFYGCGAGCGPGYGYGGYAPGCCPRPAYGYPAPAYGYPAPAYGYVAPPPVSYPIAQTGGCECANTTAYAPAVRGAQYPITSYHATPQYAPQAAWQPQYRSAPPAVAYGAPAGHPSVYGGGYPATAYSSGPAPMPANGYYDSSGIPMSSPGIAAPYPAGDIMGDHEYPAQSATAPVIPNAHFGPTPVRRISHSVSPRSARSYPSALK